MKKKKPYKCNTCGRRFSQSGALNRHRKHEHEKGKIEKLECPICKSKLSKSHMPIHIYSVHEGKKPFKCQLCDSSYSENSRLTIHVRTQHDKKKPYKFFLLMKYFY